MSSVVTVECRVPSRIGREREEGDRLSLKIQLTPYYPEAIHMDSLIGSTKERSAAILLLQNNILPKVI